MNTAENAIPASQQISEDFASSTKETTYNAASQEPFDQTSSESVKEKEKRRLFGLLKKKDGNKTKSKEALSPDMNNTTNMTTTSSTSETTPMKAIPRSITPQPAQSPPSTTQYFPASPQSRVSAASPSRYMRSSSPGLHSPSSTSIFERNVQEQPLPDDLQAAIPHHIQTEDHIPPTLEASSLVITDEQLNPDEIEIVMSSVHQPASAAVIQSDLGSGTLSPLSLSAEMPALSPSALQESGTTEEASHYGSLDSADVRRLSFISFADVVQGEHVLDNSKDLHMSVLSNATTNRSPSPIRSPASSHGAGEFGMSPPTSGAPSVKGFDLGKAAYPGSPMSLGTHSPPLVGGELTVETMRQALRKTGSGDLSHARSPVTPIEKSQTLFSSSTGEGK